MYMSVGGAEVVVFPRIAGTVVEHCRKYTVGRRRASLSFWVSSLVPRRLRRSSCSVPAVVMARVGPDPLVGVRVCTLEGPGDTWRPRAPKGGRSGTPSV